MLVNRDTRVVTETVGVNIYLNVEEARILQYILRKHHEDYVNNKNKFTQQYTYMVQANFLSEDLSKEIENKTGVK